MVPTCNQTWFSQSSPLQHFGSSIDWPAKVSHILQDLISFDLYIEITSVGFPMPRCQGLPIFDINQHACDSISPDVSNHRRTCRDTLHQVICLTPSYPGSYVTFFQQRAGKKIP